MSSIEELVLNIRKQMDIRSAGSFFLNGPAGAGKSQTIKSLITRLNHTDAQCIDFGPYSINDANTRDSLGTRILHECHELGYLDVSVESTHPMHYTDSWLWLSDNAYANRQQFIVWIELDDSRVNDPELIADLFSDIRSLEGAWQSDKFHVFTIVTGCWLEIELQEYYRKQHISFPYTSEYNSAILLGMSTRETINYVNDLRSDVDEIHGRILHEICGGHPAMIDSVLGLIPKNGMSFNALLGAAQQAAQQGDTVEKFLGLWRLLPEQSIAIVDDLLVKRHVSADRVSKYKKPLITLGLVDEQSIAGKRYLSFRSWFVELAVRLHAHELGISEELLARIPVSELVPPIQSINVDAYILLNNIENMVRNFVSVQLSLLHNEDKHYLAGKNRQWNEHSAKTEDALTRSEQWRANSKKHELSIEYNPRITYCTTRELADLVTEIGRNIDSQDWQQIGSSINELAYIRNAVMHNQLIDDSSLKSLHDLQAKIYAALSKA